MTLLRGLIILLGLGLIWAALVEVTGVEPFILPGPQAVLTALLERWPELLAHAGVTAAEILLGLLLGTLFGVSAALLVAAAPGIDPRALHSFGDRLARRGAEANFATAMELLAGWFARLIATGAHGAAPTGLVDHEAETTRRLLRAGSLDQWLDLWEKITDLARRTDRVNLDRKQVILSVFSALESAARTQ